MSSNVINEEKNNRCLIIHPSVKNPTISSPRSIEEEIEEAKGLALAISLEIIDALSVPLPKIQPSSLFGKGKIDEIKTRIHAEDIGLVIINTSLSPIQQRNLEMKWQCKVIDRTALILEIFGERASTREGTLQVELAALEYQKSRLVRSWTHLERQRGGHGVMGGPGEKQIESDRRQINERIHRIKNKLVKVKKTRSLHRHSRQAVPYPIVSLVGYTNAGKSTLFNYLTKADVYAEDQLFATLDPTMRLLELPSGKQIILSDTVGFISNLPTELIAAFRATLEEVLEADLILHVRDIAHDNSEAQKQSVLKVLEDLGLEEELDEQCIEIYNKIDCLLADQLPALMEYAKQRQDIVAISALKGKYAEYLLEVLDQKLSEAEIAINVEIPYSDGKMIAWLYDHATVLNREPLEHSFMFDCKIAKNNLGRLQHYLEPCS